MHIKLQHVKDYIEINDAMTSKHSKTQSQVALIKLSLTESLMREQPNEEEQVRDERSQNQRRILNYTVQRHV